MKTVAQELRRFLHKIDPTLTDQVYNKDDLAGYDALTASILSLPEFVEFGGFLKCGLSLVIIQLSCFRFSLFSTIQLLGIPHDFGNPKAFRRRLRPWMILIPWRSLVGWQISWKTEKNHWLITICKSQLQISQDSNVILIEFDRRTIFAILPELAEGKICTKHLSPSLAG